MLTSGLLIGVGGEGLCDNLRSNTTVEKGWE